MDTEHWGLQALTERIAAVDPTGPVPEAAAELTRLHRELTEAVGPDEARARFDEALRRALTPRRPRTAARLAPVGASAA